MFGRKGYWVTRQKGYWEDDEVVHWRWSLALFYPYPILLSLLLLRCSDLLNSFLREQLGGQL